MLEVARLREAVIVPSRERASVKRVLVLLYGLVFLDEVVLLAIIPLTPTFSEELGLSKLEAGVLLSASSLTTVIFSIPIGLLADRIGARRLTLAAGGILAGSTLGQGLAGDFGTLLASRIAFGVASTTLWTAGIAWLSDSAPAKRRSSAIGAVMVVAGIGGIVGPGFAGLLAEHTGTATPFVVTAVAAAVVTLVLARSGPGGLSEHEPQHPLATLRAAGSERVILAAFVAMVIGGIADSVVNLLAPLQLDENGLSAGSIGLAFSASAGIFLVTAAAVAHRGERAVNVRVVGASTVALACSFIPVLAGAGTGSVIGAVLARSPFLAVLYTAALPLGSEGARRAGLGRGAVIGVMNVGWGSATAFGPVAAGGVAEVAGEQVVYAALVVACVAAGAWMLAAARSARHVPAEAEAS